MSFNDFKKQSSLITSSNPFNIGYVRTPLATGGVASESDELSRHPNQLVYTEGDLMTPSLGNQRVKREYLLNPLQKVNKYMKDSIDPHLSKQDLKEINTQIFMRSPFRSFHNPHEEDVAHLYMKPPLLLPSKKLPYTQKHNLVDHRELTEKFRQPDFHKHKVLISTLGSVQIMKPPRYSPINSRNKMDFKNYNMYLKNSHNASPTAIT